MFTIKIEVIKQSILKLYIIKGTTITILSSSTKKLDKECVLQLKALLNGRHNIFAACS